MKTTLNKIRSFSPCKYGWEKLLNALGKTKADDEELHLLTILDINRIDDALWCLRAVDGYDKEKRLFAVKCARSVQHLMTDQRSIDALDIAEKYAKGEASEEDLKIAREKAYEATYAAVDTAAYAAYSAADLMLASAYEAAYKTACDAAYAVARSAEYEATRAVYQQAYSAFHEIDDIRDVAYAEARKEQEKDFREMLYKLMN